MEIGPTLSMLSSFLHWGLHLSLHSLYTEVDTEMCIKYKLVCVTFC